MPVHFDAYQPIGLERLLCPSACLRSIVIPESGNISAPDQLSLIGSNTEPEAEVR